MDYPQYIDAIRSDIGLLTSAVEAGAPTDPVPTCEGWTVNDLAVHVGDFCGFWAHVLCDGTGRDKAVFGRPPGGTALAGWVRDAGRELVEQLDATPEHTEVWTWFEGDHSAAFVARRSAHELAVHRYDAQSSRGAPDPIPSALATDGIAEIVEVLVTARDRTGRATGETMHLHGTDDEEAEWIVTLLPERIEVTRGHAKGDLALRGSACDLELTLYRRPVLGEVEVFGDRSVLDAWYREFDF